MLELRKKGNKHWLLIDEEIGEFTPSKFTINRLNNVINIVYFNNLKSKEYNVSDCYIFDIYDTSGFNTSDGVAFMDKLEELNCPCFQKDVNTFNIFADWSELTNFDALNDATLPLSGAEQIPIVQGGETKKVAVSEFQTDVSGKLDKVSTAGVERAYIINADGSQGTKATSEFGGITSVTGDSVDNTNPLNPIINAIPLSGTTEGSPVTGNIEFEDLKGISSENVSEGKNSFIGFEDGNSVLKTTDPINDRYSYIQSTETGVEVATNDPLSGGLYGTLDFSERESENKQIYAQRSYVDTKVPKVSTAGVERAYIINADGSQGTKATSELKDVLEFADLASFPVTGETSKIYLALDTNKTYRWSGSIYVQIGGTTKKTDKITYTHTSVNNINVLNTWFRFYNSQGWNNNVINANSETGTTPNIIFTNGSSRPILPNSKLVKCVLSINYASTSSPSSFEVYVGTSEFTNGVVGSTGINQQTLVLETVNFTSSTIMNFTKELTINTHSTLLFNKLYFAVREKANTKFYNFQLDFYFEEQ